MSETAQATITIDRKQEAYRMAEEIYQKGPDWVTFFREVLGVDGVVRRTFTTNEEIADFEQTSEYRDIQQMVAKLREKGGEQDNDKEPTRVITVRLPKSLHESLKTEAHSKHTSMNQLCISKLLQMIEDEMVPSEIKTSLKPIAATMNEVNRLNIS